MMPVAPPQGQPMPQAPQQGQGSQPVTIDAIMALLRDGAMRKFRIDIEVDSTVAGDESQERQDRSAFIETTTKFIETWGPIVEQQPLMAELAGELLLFGTRAFRVGRSLEEVIEETVDKFEMQAAQPKPPPPPDPKVEQAQIKAQAEGQKSQVEGQIAQMEAQFKQQEIAMKAQAEQQKLEMQQQSQKIDLMMKQLEHYQAVETHHMESARAERDHELSMEVMQHKANEAKKPKESK